MKIELLATHQCKLGPHRLREGKLSMPGVSMVLPLAHNAVVASYHLLQLQEKGLNAENASVSQNVQANTWSV